MHRRALRAVLLLAWASSTMPFQPVPAIALQRGASCSRHAARAQAHGFPGRASVGRSSATRALAATAAAAAPPAQTTGQCLQAAPCPKDARALVVFTGAGDLRVHDHGGLAAAAAASEIHCVAVLDPALLARVPDRRIRALVAAVQGVGTSLGDLGIHLEVRVGAARQEAAAAAAAAQASHVFLHADPESAAQQMLQEVAAGVADAQPQAETRWWNAALRQGPLEANEDYQSYEAALGKGSTRLNPIERSHALLTQRAAPAASAFALPPNLLPELLDEVQRVRGDARAKAFSVRAQSGGNLGDREEINEALALDLWER
jgi:hypothetical protein